ncbi:MAG: ABC-type phosphate transport system substrate-binding protein [Bermanella sp.]|jgi:ABC-type phosphate transport system substrate-binding protein
MSLTILVKADLAVIVHPNNPIKSLSHKDVQRLFLGRSVMFPATKTKIYAIDHAEDSDVYASFYSNVVKMNSNKLKKYRAYYLFSGKGRLPLILDKPDEVINRVAAIENAISYVNVNNISDKVKVVYIMPTIRR